MSISGWAKTGQGWLATHVPGSEWLMLFGAAMLVLVGLAIVGLLLWQLGRMFRAFLNSGRARKARKRNAPGFRILLSPPPGSRKTGKWLLGGLERHLPGFSFGAPFDLVAMGVIKGGLESKPIARLRRYMALADADLCLWASRAGKDDRGLEIHGLSRGGGLSPAEARLFTIALPASPKAHTEELARGAAYLIAKQLQPALSDPQAFRAEKIRQLAEDLDQVLESDAQLSSTLRNEIEADFCAAGVRVAEELGELTALDKVIRLRRQYLEEASGLADSGRILQARLDLGRALIVRAEKQFDPGIVKEAINQLAQSVEGLRSDPVIQRAQSASDALFKAQSMIESRKRFSLNFGS